jgi:hypothetical protein
MGRHPEGFKAREMVMGVRLTQEERKQYDIQRWKRGAMSRAAYLRWLMEEDADRMKREGWGNDQATGT